MKRHKSLQPLSRHHHHALVQTLEIRRARQLPAAKRAVALRLRFWEGAGQQQFREEEELLLPAYARHVSLAKDGDVMRMLEEHALIRGQVAKLREALAAEQKLEPLLEALGRLLSDHVRLEENVIYPRIEGALDKGEFEALTRGLTELHAGNSCSF